MMASLNEGDEVIIPTPCWTSYFDIVRISGGAPVAVPCGADNGFRLTAEALEAAITPRTRWLLLNSPSNPTGSAYSEDDYRPLIEVLDCHPHVWLMVDDMYEHIVYGDFLFVTPLALAPSLKARCLIVNGVSKAYAMPVGGWLCWRTRAPDCRASLRQTRCGSETGNDSFRFKASSAAATRKKKETNPVLTQA